MERDLNELSKEIHAWNKEVGWWDGDPCIYTKMQLISTEIAEATEGFRKDLMDDHLPHRKMEEVELADALIRTLDLGGKLGLKVWDFEDLDIDLSWFSEKRTTGHQHLILTQYVGYFYENVKNNGTFSTEGKETIYTMLILALIEFSKTKDFDIFGAMDEKLEYNKTRADHKRENRAKAGGKKV